LNAELNAVELRINETIRYLKDCGEELTIENIGILTQNGFDMFQRHVTSNLSKAAEQCYREFRRHYLGLEQRIAQKQIASYLGITAAFLSIMRKEKDRDQTCCLANNRF